MSDADDRLPLSTPLLDAVRAPFPGGSPAGTDMAYEDAFLQLKAQVDALGAATGGVDFSAIVDGAADILTTHSKDLSVACYLAFGLSRTQGFAGLAEGVAAVRAVAESFWDAAYPPLRRMRARQSAMQFMAERLNAWAEGERATPADRDALEHALAEATALQAFTTEAMGDEAPALSGLTRTLREALRQLPAPEAPAPEPPSTPEPPSPSAPEPERPSAPPPPVSFPTGDAVFTTPGEARETALRVAGFLREQDPYDPSAVRIARAARWGEIVQVPPAEGGRTLLPAPPELRREALAALLAASNTALLAQTAEDLFPESPFHVWLDLQRLLASALETLGPPAAAAHAAVVDTTASLVRRLPTLPALAFDDGTPFADALTVAWLDEIAAGSGGGPAVDRSPAQEATREARSQAAAGDVPGAVAALMAGAGPPRDRFERGVTAAELCLGAGRADVALALLDGADEAIRTHHLDVWDPAAAGSALRLIHAACTDLLSTPSHPDREAVLAARAADAFARLARIDPGLAMRTAAGTG